MEVTTDGVCPGETKEILCTKEVILVTILEFGPIKHHQGEHKTLMLYMSAQCIDVKWRGFSDFVIQSQFFGTKFPVEENVAWCMPRKPSGGLPQRCIVSYHLSFPP